MGIPDFTKCIRGQGHLCSTQHYCQKSGCLVIYAEIRKIFADQFGDDALERLAERPEPFRKHDDPGRKFDDLDSLDFFEFIMAVEDHFKIEIDDVTSALVRTLDDAVNVVATRISRPLHGDR